MQAPALLPRRQTRMIRGTGILRISLSSCISDESLVDSTELGSIKFAFFFRSFILVRTCFFPLSMEIPDLEFHELLLLYIHFCRILPSFWDTSLLAGTTKVFSVTHSFQKHTLISSMKTIGQR